MPATASLPPFTLSEAGDRLRIRFDRVSELDSSNCDDIGAAILAAIENRRPPEITVDLANIHFLASMALSQFLKLDQHVRSRNGRMTLANIQPDVRKVFAITRLDHVLAIDDAAANG